METKTKYVVSKKTSRGFYRIIAVYPDGSCLFVGGMYSRKFLYRTKELANAQAEIWNMEEEKIQAMELKSK